MIEGQERKLTAWDFVHCPPWTEHVFVGAGERSCAILAVGTRLTDSVPYPASPVAARHGAAVSREADSPHDAYAGLHEDRDTPYREGWLPD